MKKIKFFYLLITSFTLFYAASAWGYVSFTELTDATTGDKYVKCDIDIDNNGSTDSTLYWELYSTPSQKSWTNRNDYITTLNGLHSGAGYAGRTDWRVPTREELLFIVDYTKYNPAIDPVFNNTQSDIYWTDEDNGASINNAWGIDFTDGELTEDQKIFSHYIRGVSGSLPADPSPRFVKRDSNGNVVTSGDWAIVEDKKTGFWWEVRAYSDDDDCEYGQYTAAQTHRDSLNTSSFGGKTDWEIPSIHDLATIVDWTVTNPSIDTSFFDDTQKCTSSRNYRSRASDVNTSGHHWKINFTDASIASLADSYIGGLVRCVSGGTPPPSGVIGDMNNDGQVKLEDSIIAIQVVAGLNPSGLNIPVITLVTVNGDDNVGLEEAIYDLQGVAGLRP